MARELKGLAAGLIAGLFVVGASFGVSAIVTHGQPAEAPPAAKPSKLPAAGVRQSRPRSLSRRDAACIFRTCANCHGKDAQGQIGPTLHGSGRPGREDRAKHRERFPAADACLQGQAERRADSGACRLYSVTQIIIGSHYDHDRQSHDHDTEDVGQEETRTNGTHSDRPDTLLIERPIPPCCIVIFGATGDLTHRKLIPALFSLEAQGLLPEHFKIIGFARRDFSDHSFRDELQSSLQEFAPDLWKESQDAWHKFARRIVFHRSDFDNAQGFHLAQRAAGQV